MKVLAAMLAMMALAAAPALAQDISQDLGQEAESGDVDISFEVSSTGDFAQQCVAPLQFGNTGNLQNAQGFVQSNSDADDIEFDGSSFEFSPELEVSCDQTVQQAAAASSAPRKKDGVFVPAKEKDVVFVPVEKKDVVFVPVEKKFDRTAVAEARAGDTVARAGGEAFANVGGVTAEADGGAFAEAGGTLAFADHGEAFAEAGDTVAIAT